jgi:hypothetical protein
LSNDLSDYKDYLNNYMPDLDESWDPDYDLPEMGYEPSEYSDVEEDEDVYDYQWWD